MARSVSALTLLLALALALGAIAAPLARAQTTGSLTPTPTPATPAVAGGWTKFDVTATESALLQRALANVSSYRADVKARVCVVEIRSGTRQVVAGTNYRFVVQACAVSSDQSVGTCAVKVVTTNASVCSEYAIRVFEQVWTSTLEVAAIELLSSAEPTSAPASGSPSATPSPRATNSSSSSSSASNNSSSGTAGNDAAAATAKTPAPATTAAAKTPTPTTAAPSNAAARVLAGSVSLVAAVVFAGLSA